MLRHFSRLLLLPAACGLVVTGAVLAPQAGVAQTSAPYSTYDCDSQGSAGLQAAENSVPPGGALYVAGTCTGDLTLQADTTLEGNSAGTVIHGSVLYSGTTPVTIRDIQVNCGTETACLNLSNGWRVNIENVVTYNGKYGIELSAPSCAKGSGCNVNDYISHVFLSNSSSYAFYVNDPANTITDGFLVDSDIASSADGIYLQNAAGWRVDGNHLYGGGGMYAYRLYGSEISGNDMEAGSIQAVAQQNSEPSVIEGNHLNSGTIKQTVVSGGSGCSLSIYGNVTSGAISTAGCTTAKAANLVG